MRYAIVSDIHANMPAWQTVLNDIADLKADKIICLGDVTGYGPNPVEVLESVYRVVNVTILGNHDAAVCSIIDPALFSPRAKSTVMRHREQLAPAALEWLRQLPLTHSEPGFLCAHSDFSHPEAFRYIIEPDDALPSWVATRTQLLFVGHSHLPGIYVIGASGIPHFVGPCDFEMEEGKRYIVNPGSVGYPRVGDGRSSYCIFDDATGSITFRQLPFDSAGYRMAVQDAGLEDDPWLEQKEQQQHLPELRETPSFAKPAPPKPQPPAGAESAPPKAAPQRPFPAVAGLALGLSLLAGFVAFLALRPGAPPALAITVPDYDLASLVAYPITPADKNLLPLLPPTLTPGERLEGWRYAFEDIGRQAFSIGLRDSATTLCIRNQGPHKARLESPLINLAGTGLDALLLRGRIRKDASFKGSVFYQLVLYSTLADGLQSAVRTESFEVRSVRKTDTAPLLSLKRTVKIPKRVTHVRFCVDATFEGLLEIEQPQLTAPLPERKE